MKNGGHQWPGAGAAAFVRAGFDVTAALIDVDGPAVSVHFVARSVGHNQPTGDPFRRLVVRVCADAACLRGLALAPLSRSIGVLPQYTDIDTRLDVHGPTAVVWCCCCTCRPPAPTSTSISTSP